jgi:hypothetical protein
MGSSHSFDNSNISPVITINEIEPKNAKLLAVIRNDVIFYSKPDLYGTMYAVETGDYTSSRFIPQISPDNVFSLSIPANTSVKLFCGDVYDSGGKGFVHITNATNQRSAVPSLPLHIQGNVRSVSIRTNIIDDTNVRRNNNIVDAQTLEYFPYYYSYGFTDVVWCILFMTLILLMLFVLFGEERLKSINYCAI